MGQEISASSVLLLIVLKKRVCHAHAVRLAIHPLTSANAAIHVLHRASDMPLQGPLAVPQAPVMETRATWPLHPGLLLSPGLCTICFTICLCICPNCFTVCLDLDWRALLRALGWGSRLALKRKAHQTKPNDMFHDMFQTKQEQVCLFQGTKNSCGLRPLGAIFFSVSRHSIHDWLRTAARSVCGRHIPHEKLPGTGLSPLCVASVGSVRYNEASTLERHQT